MTSEKFSISTEFFSPRGQNVFNGFFMPLEMFAKLTQIYKNDSNLYWPDFFHCVLPSYFRSEGGRRAMRIFVAEGCKPEDFDLIDNLLELHPEYDTIEEKRTKGKKFSGDEVLFAKVLDKMDSIYESMQQNKKTDVIKKASASLKQQPKSSVVAGTQKGSR